MELARRMAMMVTMRRVTMREIQLMKTCHPPKSHHVSADPFHLGFSELSKPELLSAKSEMCKVGHPSTQFARHFGLSSSQPPSSSRVVSPHQRHCTTLASSCGTRRHCIK